MCGDIKIGTSYLNFSCKTANILWAEVKRGGGVGDDLRFIIEQWQLCTLVQQLKQFINTVKIKKICSSVISYNWF